MLVSVFFLLTIYAVHHAHSLDCRVVEEGHQFTSTTPFYGFNHNQVISIRVRFDNNTAWYLFPSTDNKGRSCTQSWNQLWGSTRCGFLTNNHQDSDRFVWRRAGSCMNYDPQGHVTGEKPNCPEADLVELGASAYNDGLNPYEHLKVLHKEFKTRARVDTWYRLKMQFDESQTIYELSDDADELLESQTIDHHHCLEYHHGMIQGFYFGGECPAPQAVSVCYD